MAKVIKLKNDTYIYGTIIEKGTNNGGDYMKYSDGTLICTGAIYKTLNINSLYETSYFQSTGETHFALEFVDKPHLIVTMENNNSLLSFNIASLHKGFFTGYVWKSQSKNNVNIGLHYIAIGRWK